MIKISIRDIRVEWPKAEKLLVQEGELIVTRDGCPVARLLRYLPDTTKERASFSAAANRAWRKKQKLPVSPWVDQALAEGRRDRKI
jgi:hypothetical protein